MSFNEKSAWAMSIIFGLATLWFGANLGPQLVTLAPDARPELNLFLPVAAIVIASIAIHTLLGIFFRKDAADGHDERDRMIMYKAGAHAGSFMGFVMMWGLWQYYAGHSAGHMFIICLLGLSVATTLNFVLQAVFYRRGH